MIGAFNYICFTFYFMFIPFAIGLLWTSKSSLYNESFAMAISVGFIMILSLFQVLAVPMILTKSSFHTLMSIWKLIVILLSVLSLILNIKRLPEMMISVVTGVFKLSRTEKILVLVTILLISLQIYMPVGHMRVDTDDARFVSEAMEAYELDTMLQYHPITGEFIGEPIGEMNKDVTSPFPIFMALGGSLLHLPPAVSTHIFFPIIFILYAYIVYYLIGSYFFDGNTKYTWLFLFFLSLIHCFAYESIYAAGYTLLAVIWQGRSVLAMVILPFIWFLLMNIMDQKDGQLIYYILLLGAVLAGLLTSSMAIELIPILIGTYAIMIGIQNKSIKPSVFSLLTLIPCLVCYCIFR